MNEWYYAEGNRQRQGPLPSESLVELYRSGRIGLDTLVWREGMPQWQPLADFAAELGLPLPAPDPAAPATPPPLPPPAGPGLATSATPTAAPTRGLSGCAIAAIVAAVAGVVLLVLVGILAAIALPAYQSYTLRARITAGHAHVASLKPQVEAFHAAQGRCPVNGEEGFGSVESYAAGPVSQVRIGRFDNGHCGLEAVFLAPGQAQMDGKALWLDLDPQTGQWQCSSEIDDRYLPRECRG